MIGIDTLVWLYKNIMKDPFKKLFANIKQSGGRSQRSQQYTYPINPIHKINITVDDLRRKFQEQGGKCYWFGIPLDPYDIFESYNMRMMSVDRLDNNIGYTYDNIVITCRFANIGRGRMSVHDTINLIKELQKK